MARSGRWHGRMDFQDGGQDGGRRPAVLLLLLSWLLLLLSSMLLMLCRRPVYLHLLFSCTWLPATHGYPGLVPIHGEYGVRMCPICTCVRVRVCRCVCVCVCVLVNLVFHSCTCRRIAVCPYLRTCMFDSVEYKRVRTG